MDIFHSHFKETLLQGLFFYGIVLKSLDIILHMTSRAYFGTKAGSAQDEAEYLTDQYLYHAVTSVDARLGEGYAKKNPQLLSTIVSLTAEEHRRIRSLEE